jgi:hypothetical protein
MIDELIVAENFEEILQDSYGNYVIQTAISGCDAKQFVKLENLIRPLLYLIKNTPYGKKIENKLNKSSKRLNGNNENKNSNNVEEKKNFNNNITNNNTRGKKKTRGNIQKNL